MTKIEELYDKLFLNPKTEGDHAFNKELIRQGFQDMLAPKEIPMTASRIAKSICMAWEEVLIDSELERLHGQIVRAIESAAVIPTENEFAGMFGHRGLLEKRIAWDAYDFITQEIKRRSGG
jgi:hypothetical protein